MTTRIETGARTRARLLEAAEELLLTTSYDELSLRAVCARARANVAAVQYHFGGKAALVAALLQDRLGPLWKDDLPRLVRGSDGAVPDLTDCVQAIAHPLRDLAADPIGQVRLHLLTRMLFAPGPQPWTDEWFALDPFIDLLGRTLPTLDEGERVRRWVCAFKLLLLQFGDPLDRRSAPSERDVDATIRFVVAGLSAPPSSMGDGRSGPTGD